MEHFFVQSLPQSRRRVIKFAISVHPTDSIITFHIYNASQTLLLILFLRDFRKWLTNGNRLKLMLTIFTVSCEQAIYEHTVIQNSI